MMISTRKEGYSLHQVNLEKENGKSIRTLARWRNQNELASFSQDKIRQAAEAQKKYLDAQSKNQKATDKVASLVEQVVR